MYRNQILVFVLILPFPDNCLLILLITGSKLIFCWLILDNLVNKSGKNIAWGLKYLLQCMYDGIKIYIRHLRYWIHSFYFDTFLTRVVSRHFLILQVISQLLFYILNKFRV